MDITHEELKEAAIPLIKLLNEKGHKYMCVVVTYDTVQLLKGQIGVSIVPPLKE